MVSTLESKDGQKKAEGSLDLGPVAEVSFHLLTGRVHGQFPRKPSLITRQQMGSQTYL